MARLRGAPSTIMTGVSHRSIRSHPRPDASGRAPGVLQQQGAEVGLDEAPVGRQRLGQAPLLHDHERCAVGLAPVLVAPGAGAL